MQFLNAAEVAARTPWPDLMTAIADELRDSTSVAPERHVHPIEQAGGSTGSLLLMPSWRDGDLLAVKVVTYFPSNAGTDVPTINAAVLVFDGSTGEAEATIDGDELTARRTAATSALAASILAHGDASRLLVVGTGQLAPNMARAYAHIRPLEQIDVWGRDPDKAAAVASRLRSEGLPADSVTDLRAAAQAADIITCVTGAASPLVHGEWLQPGTHLDLVGSFRADMREADDAAVTQSTVFVDTVAGASNSGDLAQPLEAGVLAAADIQADLRALVAGDHHGRTDSSEITLFKSAGFALADLAATRLAWRGSAD